MERNCRVCGTDKQLLKANICEPCNKVYMKEYRKQNRIKLSKQVHNWKINNKEKHHNSCKKRYRNGGKALQDASLERSVRTFLAKKISTIGSLSRNPGRHDPKDPSRREYDIDVNYAVDLFDKQGGKCAISGVKMTTKIGDLASVSIDRIDPKLGHIKGNIHLVCEGINYMKRHRSNEEAVGFISQIQANNFSQAIEPIFKHIINKYPKVKYLIEGKTLYFGDLEKEIPNCMSIWIEGSMVCIGLNGHMVKKPDGSPDLYRVDMNNPNSIVELEKAIEFIRQRKDCDHLLLDIAHVQHVL